jgi:hypothetical protein
MKKFKHLFCYPSAEANGNASSQISNLISHISNLPILAFCFLPFGVFAQFGGGNGLSGDPYQIANATHLTNLANKVNAGDTAYNNKHYILTDNIDLSGNDNWIPIGNEAHPFQGVFNGNQKVVNNLQINTFTLEHAGLFGYLEHGSIEKLGIKNADLSSSSDFGTIVGGIAGCLLYSKIENCYFSGIVSINAKGTGLLGGVAGSITTSSIINCYTTGVVASECSNSTMMNIVGGIVGFAIGDCNITNCYSTAGVICKDEAHGGAGGIAGYLFSNKCSATNCAALNPNINCESKNFGRIAGGFGTLSNNVAFNKMTNLDFSPWIHPGHDNLDGEGINAQFINTNATLGNRFKEADGWVTEAGKLPVLFGNAMYMPVHLQDVNGDSPDPYLIYAAEQLKSLSDFVNAENGTLGRYYTLMNDIDLSDYPNWIPIGRAGFLFSKGDPDLGFTGVFDGNKNKISGLKIRDTQFNISGLFGIMLGGIIKNVGIEDADIRNGTPNSFTGGVVGVLFGGKIINCYFTGIVSTNCSTKGTAISATGGIAGLALSSITNCYSLGTVNSTALFLSAAGGITGLNMGQVLHCYSAGIVSNNGLLLPVAGGIIGVAEECKVSNCAALNPSISEGGLISFFGRIVGAQDSSSADTLINNIAFSEMRNPYNMLEWEHIGLSDFDGADFTAQQINADGTLGGRFTSVNGWTTENGKLPGLFGKAVDMPPHLKNVGVAETHCNASLQVYPNPTTGELRIMNNEQLTMNNVEVYDVYGKRIVIPNEAQRNEESKTINISHLANGIYFLKIDTEQGTVVQKVIKN